MHYCGTHNFILQQMVVGRFSAKKDALKLSEVTVYIVARNVL